MKQAYGKIDGFLLYYGEKESKEGKVVERRPIILHGEMKSGMYIFHPGDKEEGHAYGFVNARSRINRLFPDDFEKASRLFENIDRPEDNYSFEDIIQSSVFEDIKTLLRYTRDFDTGFFNHPDWRIRMVITVNNSNYFDSLKDDSDFRILTEIISRTNKFNEYFIEKIKSYSADEDVQGIKPAYMHSWVRAEIYKRDQRLRDFLKKRFSWDTMLEKWWKMSVNIIKTILIVIFLMMMGLPLGGGEY